MYKNTPGVFLYIFRSSQLTSWDVQIYPWGVFVHEAVLLRRFASLQNVQKHPWGKSVHHGRKHGKMKNVPGRDVVCSGGEAGIRTLVTGFTGKTVFETAAFNRSATSPQDGLESGGETGI